MFNVEIKSERDEDICLLVKVDNHSYNYICECGEAKKLGVKECQNTNAIFLSHTHIDHFVNFDTVLRHQIGIQRKIIIVGPRGIINQVQSRIKSYCWNLIEEGSVSYEVREVQELGSYKTAILSPPLWEKEEVKIISSNTIFEEKNFIVEYELLDHKTTSIAYLFKGVDKTKIELTKGLKGGKWVGELKKAFEANEAKSIINIEGVEHNAEELFHLIKLEKGRKLGVIMDHAAHKENHDKILEKYFGCEDVYIECFYKDEDKESAIKNYHSYASQSGEIMKACKVSNAVPVHFSRKYDDSEIDELILQFEKARKENGT